MALFGERALHRLLEIPVLMQLKTEDVCIYLHKVREGSGCGGHFTFLVTVQ